MFILNHVVLDLENVEVFFSNFVFETEEQAEKAKIELDAKYDLIKDSNSDYTIFSNINEINVQTDNRDIIKYLNKLNDIRLDVDDEYTEQEYEEVKNKINR